EETRQRDDDDEEIDWPPVAEERFSDPRDVDEKRDRDLAGLNRVEVGRLAQKARQAEQQRVERQPDDERVRAQSVAELGVHEGHDEPGERSEDEAPEDRAGDRRTEDAEEGAAEHRRLDRDVEGSGSLGRVL